MKKNVLPGIVLNLILENVIGLLDYCALFENCAKAFVVSWCHLIKFYYKHWETGEIALIFSSIIYNLYLKKISRSGGKI